VYNSTEQEFFGKLTDNQIDTFLDIRQRRGVRGAKYAFVNSKRLQQKLLELGINYGYAPELAPTTEIRNLQKAIDENKGELKRERQALGQVFIIEYKNRILSHFDFENFIEGLEKAGSERIALFCVEQHPEACHRSLVTDKLKSKYKYHIKHL
jgi:uncharacterized protein (DUF488 family)